MTNELSSPDTLNALNVASKKLALAIDGPVKFGWNRKSAGCRVLANKDEIFWLRVQHANIDNIPTKLWDGEVTAGTITGVSKPILHRHIEWMEDDILWRATISSLVTYDACSLTPQVSPGHINITHDWLIDLRSSLNNLSNVHTDRICCRQDLITRRINEAYGSTINAKIDEWETCHGDLHWANVTCPKLVILDWESWGIGPLGLDPAFLMAFSAQDTSLISQIYNAFKPKLETNSGKRSILFACAELLRMIELYGDHPELESGLRSLSENTLNSLYLEV